MTSLPTGQGKQYLDILGSRSTQHLAIRVLAIILIVWVATQVATPANILWIHTSQNTPNPTLGPSTLAWHRAAIVSIVAKLVVIIALAMKGGLVYQDDLVFIAIITIYCLYWWQQWWVIRETFIGDGGIGGGVSLDTSILSTGLTNDDWDSMAMGRTWQRDLQIPSDRGQRLVAGINRPEHYDFAPDDIPMYQLEPELANVPPSIEMKPEDLVVISNSDNATPAGMGVKRRFAQLGGPLPDGRTAWHTQHTEHQIATVLDPDSRSGKHARGLPSDFARQGWGRGRESMEDMPATQLGTSGLTPAIHRKWLAEHGYTYFGEGGDEMCRRALRVGCGLDGAGRGECRHPHYCTNLSPPTKQHLQKAGQGGGEMLGYP